MVVVVHHACWRQGWAVVVYERYGWCLVWVGDVDMDTRGWRRQRWVRVVVMGTDVDGCGRFWVWVEAGWEISGLGGRDLLTVIVGWDEGVGVEGRDA